MERTGSTLLVNDGIKSMSMMIGRSAWPTQNNQAVVRKKKKISTTWTRRHSSPRKTNTTTWIRRIPGG